MSVITSIQTDLAAAIQALPSFAAETIKTGWMPTVERKNLTAREIYIDPELRETKLISRGCKQTNVSMIVAFVAPHKQNQEDAIAEAEQVLIDEIFEHLLGVRVGTQRGLIEAIEQPVLIADEHWRQFRQATSVLRVRIVL